MEVYITTRTSAKIILELNKMHYYLQFFNSIWYTHSTDQEMDRLTIIMWWKWDIYSATQTLDFMDAYPFLGWPLLSAYFTI